MGGKENNGQQFWEKNLAGCDFSNFGPRESLINKASRKIPASSEQLKIFQQVREVLKPYEEYLHAQAETYVNYKVPANVKKSHFGYTYSFFTTPNTEESVKIKIKARKSKSKVLCTFFSLDGHVVKLNKDGRIKRIERLMITEGGYGGIEILDVEKSQKMRNGLGGGVSLTSFSTVQKDGTMDGWFREEKNENLFVEFVDRAMRLVIPQSIQKQ